MDNNIRGVKRRELRSCHLNIRQKGDAIMEQANKSIRCTVTSCQNHCCDKDYCKLDSIQVGTHEANPTMDQCTDCQSFVKRG